MRVGQRQMVVNEADALKSILDLESAIDPQLREYCKVRLYWLALNHKRRWLGNRLQDYGPLNSQELGEIGYQILGESHEKVYREVFPKTGNQR